MSKTIMTLHLPEAKIRKAAVRAVQKHKDKSKYNRKAKHKGLGAEAHRPLLFNQSVKTSYKHSQPILGVGNKIALTAVFT